MNFLFKRKEEKVGCFGNYWFVELKFMIYNYGYMYVYGG